VRARSRPQYGAQLGRADKDGLVTLSEEFEAFLDELADPPLRATAAEGDATPSVKGLGERGVLTLANAAPVNVTGLDDGDDLQEIVLLCSTGNTTLVHSATFRLSGGANVTPAADSTLVMKRIGTAWRQVAPVITT